MPDSELLNCFSLISHINHTFIRSTGATILMLAYGYKVESNDDRLVRIAEDAMVGFAKASEPGAFLVDRIPFCKTYIVDQQHC